MQFLFYYAFLYVAYCQETKENSNIELKSVVVIYRHGDRAPSKSFPTDPYFNKKYWPMGFGQLTNEGKKRLYNLGKWLRTTYNDFLPHTYSSEDIYVYSTDYDRTLMSAAASLAGLYPPINEQNWNDNLQWQPIPIHTMPDQYDHVLCSSESCPKYQKLYENLEQSEFFKDVNEDYSVLYETLSNYTGWNVTNVYYFSVIHSAFYVYQQVNTSYIPQWYNSFDPDIVEYLAALYYSKYSFTPELSKLGNGMFFYKLLEHFDKVVQNDTKFPKLLMLSAHESNIASILNSFNVFDHTVPEFGATIIWEIRRSVDRYVINMLYKENDTYIKELIIPNIGCDFECDYNIFKTFLVNNVVYPDKRPSLCAV